MNPRFKTPRAAYVHVPFCRHRCGYCNFTLVAGRDDLVPRFLRAVATELEQLGVPREVDTLFLGGGTPTHLSPSDLGEFLKLVCHWLPLSPANEFTVEANPNDIGPETVELLAASGVTRVSLGAQSFDQRKLDRLDREHRREDIESAATQLLGAGFRLSLDLIFGVSGESIDAWREDLESAVSLGPHHLSTYSLTVEKGTKLWSQVRRGETTLATDDTEAELYETAVAKLRGAGFEHYEVSNFCKPGEACRHNLNYWRGGTYFAFGPGAASHVDGERRVNHRSTTTYLKRMQANQSPVAETESLSSRDAALERLVFGLREIAGIDCEQFAAETGHTVRELAEERLDQLLAAGHLRICDGRLQVTHAGLLLCDSIAEALLA